jgi:hypothetical protein
MFRHGEIVGPGWLLCEHAHLVDEVGDELAPPDVEYLDRLSCSLEGRSFTYRVARGTVSIDQVPSSS